MISKYNILKKYIFTICAVVSQAGSTNNILIFTWVRLSWNYVIIVELKLFWF